MSQMVEAAERGDFAARAKLHAALLPLMLVNFVESNPVPVKAAMAAMGLLEEVYRLPMVPPRAESRAKILRVLNEIGPAEDGVSQGERVSDSTDSQSARSDIERLFQPRRIGGQEREPHGVRDASRRALGRPRARGRARCVNADGLARQCLGEAGNPARVPLRRISSTSRSTTAVALLSTRTRCR